MGQIMVGYFSMGHHLICFALSAACFFLVEKTMRLKIFIQGEYIHFHLPMITGQYVQASLSLLL
ncbi:hypothetical protein A9404_08430 [Halothiobacillus diazotrophicus]|uniref:Uncharacterized protein n=1 Tax=Halothiobacillus diazotrophicus TaxID=1860122 RepID=A0A191ZHR9_9GAMM|nr:hypothetical protein A9404_08430 [Halothiobacillus diazotrophicus]